MSQNTIFVMNQIFNGLLKMNQVLQGSNQADRIVAQAPNGGSIYGLGGNDVIDISGKDSIFSGFGGQGDDTMNVTYNNAKNLDLFGGEQNDKLCFGGSNNQNVRMGMLFGNNETNIRAGSNHNNARVYIGQGNNKFSMARSNNNSLTFVGSQDKPADGKGFFMGDLYGDYNTYNGFTGNVKDSLYVNGNNNTFGNLDLGGGDDHLDLIGNNNVGTVTTGAGKDELSVTGHNNHMNINADKDDKIILEGNMKDWHESKDSSGNRIYTRQEANSQSSSVTIHGDAQVTSVGDMQAPPPANGKPPVQC